MNGLEQILLKIEEDNNNKIKQITEEIINDGKAQAAELTAEAQKQADKILTDAQKKAARIAESAAVGSKASAARKITAAKAEIINDCMLHAAQQLKNLPDDKYFDALLKLILMSIGLFLKADIKICSSRGRRAYIKQPRRVEVS